MRVTIVILSYSEVAAATAAAAEAAAVQHKLEAAALEHTATLQQRDQQDQQRDQQVLCCACVQACLYVRWCIICMYMCRFAGLFSCSCVFT